jgi:K+/H+ antiporter YhaU regulatory subunit KhtT
MDTQKQNQGTSIAEITQQAEGLVNPKPSSTNSCLDYSLNLIPNLDEETKHTTMLSAHTDNIRPTHQDEARNTLAAGTDRPTVQEVRIRVQVTKGEEKRIIKICAGTTDLPKYQPQPNHEIPPLRKVPPGRDRHPQGQ